MKKSMLFSVALAGLMLGSCSSSDDLNGSGTSGFSENGDGFVAVAINLPTQKASGSRANDNFDDGTTEEYEVKNGKLLLFTGANEANATFVQAYPLTIPTGNQGESNKQITTRYQQTVKISSSGLSSNIYALVILNDNGQNYTVGDKLAKVLTVSPSTTLKGNGFLMSNAPLSTAKGGSTFDGQVNTLVPILADNIQKTEADAANHALEISVERALAKIQMSTDMIAVQDGEYTGTLTKAGVKNGTQDVYYSVTGWELANTNTKTYFTRQWNNNNWATYAAGNNVYRFIGKTSLNDDTQLPSAELYRTYWGVDPNYDAFTTGELANSKVSNLNQDKIKYCLENTFNVKNQKIQSSTCAIVGVQFFTADASTPTKYTPMTDFYTVDSDPTVVYDKSTIQTLILGRYVAQNSTELSGCIDGTVSALDLLEVEETSSEAGVVSYTVKTKDDSHWVTSKKPTAEQLANWKNSVDVSDLEHVKNGINYYYVPIRHFEEPESPWTAEGKSTAYPEPDAEKNWLGRYGVLRNNWYDFNVNGVSGFGSATIPDLSNNTDDDDNLKEYISVKINVLSWAKRTQSAILGK